ncbi:AraC family transcriptional regulator [Actinacidiphila guanduensis]|uniref:Transcriptional regulator, AraC family n=1 Tax=Actinacidiphila guanduensis TaxID=310781 RepID=A0A1H0LAC3_9ACTN|nr:AraC family transcriptional regulator [Actinacidiphila guanduensis]SDO65075.1 transcriptional regulator, AraC family [Actinacidiphila guanduensis]
MSVVDHIDRPHSADLLDTVDPLEDVLALIGARAERAATLTGHGEWSLRFPPPAGAKFNAVLEGSCYLTSDVLERPLTLRAGDTFLLTRPQEFTLSTAPHLPAQAASPLFRATRDDAAVTGPPTQPVTARLVGGSFTFGRQARALLLDALPPVIHMPAHADGASMAPHVLTRIDHETRTRRLGANPVTEHLAVVLLIDMIRHHLSGHPGGTGWLHGLNDPVVAIGLRAIHTDPARHWTVRLLADTAHVSRSAFATRFKRTVGQGPLEYLTRWRLELGAQRLATTEQTIAAIADSVGYGSEAAFSLAFKRELGTPPGTYRRQAHRFTQA